MIFDRHADRSLMLIFFSILVFPLRSKGKHGHSDCIRVMGARPSLLCHVHTSERTLIVI